MERGLIILTSLVLFLLIVGPTGSDIMIEYEKTLKNNSIALRGSYTPHNSLSNNQYIEGSNLKFILDNNKKVKGKYYETPKTINPADGKCTIDFSTDLINVRKNYLVTIDDETGIICIEGDE